MRPRARWFAILQILGLLATAAQAVEPVNVVISIPEQRLYVFNEAGDKVGSYRVSTSQYGVGDSRGSYTTPLGQLAIASKMGHGAPLGTVFKGGHRTGEICQVNARGRDPIVTRILHLRGMEQQNCGAYGRCIYIHGTPDERRIGQAVSYGCIRMKSRDVIEVFDQVTVGTPVEITQERLSQGLFTSVTRRPAPIADGPARSESAPKTVASVRTPGFSAGKPGTLAATAHHSKLPESKREPGNSSVRLMETSGLSINFGGSTEESDRPR